MLVTKFLTRSAQELKVFDEIIFVDVDQDNITYRASLVGLMINKVNFAAVCEQIAKCVSLQCITFRFDFRVLEEFQIVQLFDILAKCENLQKVIVSIVPDDPKKLIFFSQLPKLSLLQEFSFKYISSGFVDKGSIQALFAGLTKCSLLQRISFFGNAFNSLDQERSQALAEGLLNCRALQTLDLSNTGLGELDILNIEVLAKGLFCCSSLQTLDLSYNALGNLTKESIKVLFARISRCPSLQTLDLGFNNLTLEQEMQFLKMRSSWRGAPIMLAQTQTLLLCWRRLREQPVVAGEPIGLGDMPEEIVLKILEAAGAITNIRINPKRCLAASTAAASVPSSAATTAAASVPSSAATTVAAMSTSASAKLGTASRTMLSAYMAEYKRQKLELRFIGNPKPEPQPEPPRLTPPRARGVIQRLRELNDRDDMFYL